MNSFYNRFLEYIRTDTSLVVLIINKEGIIISANQPASHVSGRALINRHISEFFTGFNAGLDLEVIFKEGIRKRMLNINTYNNIPETLYFTSFATDDGIILLGETDNLEIEQMRKILLDSNNELNNLTRQLQKQNIQLDQLNQLKNQFLGMAAHDLRNPIASILMFSDFVLDTQEEGLTPELKEILNMIRTSSEFMLKLLEELLDVVKIESGKLELNMVRVNIEDFLRKSIKFNQIIAAHKEIKLILNIPHPIPDLYIDPVKMEQVVNNLVSNAIKYSHHNTKVTISAFSTGKEVAISIQDQGQGIPANELDKIFTPFAKISVASTAGEKSTGLGLSIVKKIITGHLGRIWVESQVGAGSVFHFTLPLNIEKFES